MTKTPVAKMRPRTFVANELRAMRADLLTALDRWRTGRTITMPRAEATPRDRMEAITPNPPGIRADMLVRLRMPWEFPEWRVADWQVLDRELAHLIEQATALRAYAAEQVDALKCTECARELPTSEARAGFTACERCAKGEVVL
jgi:hypothetical protein